MKKILLPTDFSQVSENALQVATTVARKTGAEVELLHIVDAPNSSDFSASGDLVNANGEENLFILKSIEAANLQMKKIMDDIKYVGVRFFPKIKVGNPYKYFTNYIVEEKTDLIIMGTKGSTGFFKGFFNSSNAEKVMTHSNCMMLAVKNVSDNFKIKNVVFATNFEDDSPEFLQKLIGLQEVLDFKIHLIYINAAIGSKKDLSEIEKLEKQFVKTHKLSDYEFHIVDNFTEYTGITDYSNKIHADMIVLSNHQHKGLHWLGGISEDLVNFADQPILTYKSK